MDNATRSERSRKAVLDAAIAIIARDGPGRLTLDAIARESGISKGGLMHQFRSKEAVLKGLLDRHREYFDEFSAAYLAKRGATQRQPQLAVQIAALREGISTPRSIFFALFGAAAEEPSLLCATREGIAKTLESIKDEGPNSELTILRWMAAWGLNLTSLLGLSPLSETDREQFFDYLLDDELWSTVPPPRKREPSPTAARKAKRRPRVATRS